MQIKQFQVAEDINDLKLDSNNEIIGKCDEKDKESVIHILNEYEKFKNEIEEKINDSNDFIEIKCNPSIDHGIINKQLRNQNIRIKKEDIKKVEYFKGYTSATRIETKEKIYYVNIVINDDLLIKYTSPNKRY